MAGETERIMSALERGDRSVVDRLMRDPSITLGPNADVRGGAPASVRAAVGAAPNAQDRLATIRRFYPDAQPHGTDNFVFNNPRTGRPTLYNPQGLDWGDVASIGPEIGEFLGGAMGGVAAAPAAIAGAPATGGMSFLAVPAGVGLGAAAGREIVGAAARYFNGTQDSRSVPERVTDAGVTVGMNAASVPVGNALAGLARRALGPVARVMGPASGQQAVDDFANAGVRPMAGAVTGNRTVQGLEAALEATPGGAGPIMGAREEAARDLGSSVRQYANTLGTPTDPLRVGSVLREGAEQAGNRFQARQQELYDRAFSLVPPSARSQFPSVQALQGEIESALARAPESRDAVLSPVLERINRLLADAGDNGLSFQAIRDVRTDIGRILGEPRGSFQAPSSATRVELERLYGAMSEDMYAAIRNPATPWREQALRLADRYTRFNQTQNMDSVRGMLDTNTDEQLYRMVFPQNGRPDAQALARFRRNMTPEQWGDVQATVLDRMGMPTPGSGAGEEFSVNTFLTNWNRLSQNGSGARNVLFGGSGNTQVAQDLDRFARVAQRMRDAERLRNWSGTARALGTGAALWEGGNDVAQGDWRGAATVVALGAIAPRYAAQMLTNPNTVRWLAGATPAMQDPNTQRAALARLGAIAEANPAIRDAVQAFQQTFNPANQQPQRQ